MARQVVYDNGGSLSTIAAFLKEDYTSDDIRSLVNTSTELLTRIKTKPTQYGQHWVEPLKLAVAQGSGARPENGTLPDEGFGAYDRIMGNVKYLYGRFYITGPSIKASRGNKAAFKDALATALDDTKEGFKQDVQRQSWGDGSAILGRVKTTANSATIAVSDPYGLTYDQADLQPWERVMTFRENMPIWFFTPGGAGTSLFRTIAGVDDEAGTILLNSAASVVAGDVIYKGSATDSNNAGYEVMGVSGFVKKTGMYFNLDRTGRSVLQSTVITFNGSSAALEDDLLAANSSLFRKSTEQSDMVMFSNTRVHDMHVKNLRSERRQVNPVELKSGQDAIEWGGKTWVKDKDCPPQRLYWLRMADIFWRQMGDDGWMDEDGAILNRVPKKDAYEAVWARYTDMTTRAPANHGMIQGIIQA